MKKGFLLLVVMALCTPLFAEYPWPLVDPQLVQSFLDYQDGDFRPGILIQGEGLDILSPLEGMILRSSAFETDSVRLYPGYNAYLVLDNRQGLRLTLAGDFVSLLEVGTSVSEGEVLAQLGPGNPGLTLFAWNERDQEIINPLNLLQPLTDVESPVIRSVAIISNQDQERVALVGVPRVPLGFVTVSVTAQDPLDSQPRTFRGIQRITLVINGQEIHNLEMDRVTVDSGQWVNGFGLLWSDLLGPGYVYRFPRIFVTQGVNTLEVTVSDHGGNVTRRSYRYEGRRQ